jgi:hypothetical protein
MYRAVTSESVAGMVMASESNVGVLRSRCLPAQTAPPPRKKQKTKKNKQTIHPSFWGFSFATPNDNGKVPQ